MNHLVIGCGEVGAALREVLACDGYDTKDGIIPLGVYEMVHICIPYSERFCAIVEDYRDMLRSRYFVIHSTIPIGTSERLGMNHSPVRGRHPGLAVSLKTFAKYVGGPDSRDIVMELRRFGIPAFSAPSSRDTEAGKLLDLMQFGAAILLEKEIHRFCEENGIDFEVAYTQFNETYNRGFASMGFSQFSRPVLKHMDGPIGGHCVAQSMDMLPLETASRIADFNCQAVWK